MADNATLSDQELIAVAKSGDSSLLRALSPEEKQRMITLSNTSASDALPPRTGINGVVDSIFQPVGRAIRNHPAAAGAMALGIPMSIATGGLAAGPAIALAGLAGAGGAGGGLAASQWANRDTAPLPTVRGNVEQMTSQGAQMAAGEGIGRGLTAGAQIGSKWLMDRALNAREALLREFPNVAQSMIDRALTVSRGDLKQAQTLLSASANKTADMIQAADAARPRVAGLLPEASHAVPLGEPPVPAGGASQTVPATVTQKVRWNKILDRQGMSRDPGMIERIYGANAANNVTTEALPDVVEGAGTIARPMNAAPGLGAPPQMVAPDVLASTVRQDVLSNIDGRALRGPDSRRLGTMIDDFLKTHTGPMTLAETQALKQSEQELSRQAYTAYASGKAVTNIPALFHEAVASAAQKAIEARVPSVGAQNAETQALIGIQKAIQQALRPSISNQFIRTVGQTATGGAIGGLVGSQEGHPGAGALAGAALATPQGLSHLSLLLANPAIQTWLRQLPKPAVEAATSEP